ncbi:CDP-abequose synthase [Lentzea sp. NBRC 105346]|uniref:NAD-dependent epimerase/dehydratase family protein n=1 Tax=Lentzea sp. NBRC 105346 TaxID=3032205 RepID=UPI0024A5C308|nr:NAD-dependent epimerase/dehydratase family protein [Lentzea sp. NBRC 105346]GLZ28877.1 CDP-abequose synthase [Lentzea sp. NBRC 105346]
MRVLVTGGSGFIGAHLIRRLKDVEVHAVSRHDQVPEHGERWHAADLTDAVAVRELVERVQPEAVLHLASEVTGVRDVHQVRPVLDANLLSVINLLTVCADRGTRVILAGSVEEPQHGEVPSSPYAAAKSAATNYARMFHALYQVPVTVLRLAMVYGPGQKDTGKLLPYVTLSLLRKEEPRLTNGTRLIDWIYVEDVVEAFVAAMCSDRAAGAVLDVGSGEQVSIRDTVELLIRVAGSDITPQFGAVAARPLDSAQVMRIGPTADTIGWKPQVDLEEGLRRTLYYYANTL